MDAYLYIDDKQSIVSWIIKIYQIGVLQCSNTAINFFVIYILAARLSVGYSLFVMFNRVGVLHISIVHVIWYSGLYTAIRLQQSICGVIKFHIIFC